MKREEIVKKVLDETKHVPMDEKDVLCHFMLIKAHEKKPFKLRRAIRALYTHVQKNPIYFKYEPQFYEGVIIFGIVGYQEEQDKFMKFVGKKLHKFNIKMELNATKENTNEGNSAGA